MNDSERSRVQIIDDDRLLRRILDKPPEFLIKPDGTPSSSNFTLRKGEAGLSVDIEGLTTHEKAIQDPKKFRLYFLKPPETRSLGLVNVHDPIEGNYAHTLIKGDISKSIARKLAKKAMPVRFRR